MSPVLAAIIDLLFKEGRLHEPRKTYKTVRSAVLSVEVRKQISNWLIPPVACRVLRDLARGGGGMQLATSREQKRKYVTEKEKNKATVRGRERGSR